ncbi:MAG: AtpZ/AtpI family protein [Planctomycetes bacterium]|nr:AtpZ/AtpI family protein [Planctomycetota bacterium]
MTGPRRGNSSDLLKYADLGTRLALLAALFSYGGYQLDQWLQTGPIFLLVGALLGMGAGMYSVVMAVDGWGSRRKRKDAEDEEPPPDEPT